MFALAPPPETWLRLSRVAEITGWPETTLKQAIQCGRLYGMKVRGLWHTSLSAYNAWIEEEAERGGDLSTAPQRLLASRGQAAGTGNRRTLDADPPARPGSPAKKARRRKRGRLPIVIDMGSFVDSDENPPE